MKPQYLKLSAFGSYGECTEVDFANMQQGIFLITGDTGAGKTTIFDAMMYALYDETSGGRRDGAMMRSQYATPDKETYVEFAFSYRKREYKIRRNPEYFRAGKRRQSDGSPRLVKESAKVELTMPDGTAFQGRKREVDEKIQDIIGLNAEQFRQVAMIAQGDFLKLLHAPSKERKLIFSKIFHTKIYWQLQEKLKEEARKQYYQIEEQLRMFRQEASAVECPEDSKYYGSWKEKKDSPEFSAEEMMEVLGRILEENKEALGQVEYKRKEAKDHLEEIEEILRLQENLKQCRKDEEDNRKKMKTLTQWLMEQQGSLRELNKVRREKEELLTAREPGLREKITRIQDSMEKYLRLEECLGIYKDREKRQKALRKEMEKAEKILQQNLRMKERLSERAAKLEGIGEELILHRTQLEQQKKSREQLLNFREQLRQLNVQEKICEKQLKEYQEAQNKAQCKSTEYDEMYRAFFREQAGILAQKLEEGKPCPVCGALSHPQKTKLSETAPSQWEVEKAKKQREDAEGKREQAFVAYRGGRERWESQVETLTDQGRIFLEKNSFQPDDKGIMEVEKSLEKREKEIIQGQRKMERLIEQSEKRKQAQEELKLLTKEEEVNRNYESELVKEQQDNLVLIKELEKEIQIIKQGLLYEDSKEAVRQQKILEKELEGYRRESAKSTGAYEKLQQTIHVREGELKAGKSYGETLCKQADKAQNLYEKYQKKAEHILGPQETPQEGITRQQREIQSLEKIHMALYAREKKNREAYNRLKQYWEGREELQKAYVLYNDLHKTANGTLSGSIKMDFETYVQRQYFKQIIFAANKRLVQMNNQQFILQCREVDKLGSQGQVGLDLDVCHLLSNTTRDVKTLSGGESFMAALAMALGLADIIQNGAGAIRLDTMFVDEGFGSLDDESRAQAIQVLLELANDSRVVGIISHVNELKEQIDRKLIVTKSDKGSTITWMS